MKTSRSKFSVQGSYAEETAYVSASMKSASYIYPVGLSRNSLLLIQCTDFANS